MNEEKINNGYYQSNIKTSRNDDSVYAMKYASQQMLIDKLQQENQELKKQLEEERNKVREYSYKLSNFRCEETYENQQKEFIEYMNETIEELECDDVGDEELKGYLIQRTDAFKEILSKYKEIIGDKE